MKRLILILLLLMPLISSAQYNYYTKLQSDANDLKVLDTSQAHIDTVSRNLRLLLAPYAFKSYVDSSVGVSYGLLQASIGQTNANVSALAGAVNGKVNYNDTAFMLNPYLRKTTAAATYQPVLGYTPYNATNPNGYISTYTETDPISFHNSDTGAKFAALRALIVNYAAGYGLTLVGSTFKADSNLLTTRLRLQGVVDSLNNLIAQKQAQLTLTTTGTTGAATLTGNTLNVPQYTGTAYTASSPIKIAGTVISGDTGRAVGQLATGGDLNKVRDSTASVNDGRYIQNQTSTTQTAGYKINGNATAANFIASGSYYTDNAFVGPTLNSGGAIPVKIQYNSNNIFYSDGTTNTFALNSNFIGNSSTAGYVLMAQNNALVRQLGVYNNGLGIQTASPSGGTAAPIVFGSIVTGSGGTNKYLMIASNGTIAYIPIFVQSTVPN